MQLQKKKSQIYYASLSFQAWFEEDLVWPLAED